MTRTPHLAAQTARHALAGTVAAWRQRARLRRDLASLDDRTLRDLGFDRSEWQSALAESSGDAEATRRRIAPRLPSTEPGQAVAAPWRPRPLPLFCTSAAAALVAAVSLAGCGGSPGAPLAEAVAHRQTLAAPAKARPADDIYLPSRFPPPDGPIEPLPAQL